MNIRRRSVRLIRAFVALTVIAVFGPAKGSGFDLNHYILGCGQVCTALFAPIVPGTIDATFTGSWYDPNQNGHGISIEVLPEDRMLVYWFTFAPAGTQQAWLVGTGTYSGNVATIDAVDMPTGGRWIPGFDPKQVVHNAWGSLKLTFTDANHGNVEFRSSIGFGAGSMNLVRLTQLAGINAAGASPSGDAWMQINAMSTPRAGHSATLLADGTVLVVGGVDGYGPGEGVLATTELFDPQTGLWSRGPSLNEARTGHSATRLADGTILVAGGYGGRDDPSIAEVYNPETGTWHTTGALNVKDRFGHTATLLNNGKVLVVGDLDTPDPAHYLIAGGDTELYDPKTGTWTVTGKMHEGRAYGHSATLLQDGRVLVVGGATNYDDDLTNSAELYDPAAGTWSVTAPCPFCGGAYHAAVLLPDGTVLVAGGISNGPLHDGVSSTSMIYDPVSGTWRSIPDLARPSLGDNAAVLPNGDVEIAGATGSQRYDVANSRWIDGGRLNLRRVGPTTTFLPNGEVLVAGGGIYDSASTENTDGVEVYGPVTATYQGRYSGTWYDPAQTGHGLLLESLTNDRLLAEWFAFDPGGTQQSWFLGVGSVNGNTATITAVDRPTGGRFIPNFDPSKIVHNPWGSLTLTFTDCDHGRVDFASPVAGYGSGSMNLTRLTRPAGVSCP